MDRDKFNGWTNHSTWLVNLWLGDDVQAWINDSDCEEWGLYDVECVFRDFLEELTNQEKITCGLLSDLLKSAVDDVNWRELAEHVELPSPKTLEPA